MQEIKEFKPPKQWRRWVKRAGLKDSYSSNLRREYGSAYFTGFGRHWRMACDGCLDMSETFESFDRWANSVERSEPMNADNEDQFIELVTRMRAGTMQPLNPA